MNLKKIIFNNFEDFDFINTEYFDEIKLWFEKFNETNDINKIDKKVILISGPSGSFRTTFASFICKYFNFEERQFNAIDLRGGKSIKEFISQILNNRSVLHMLHNTIVDICITIDDLDIGDKSGDKNIIGDLLSLLHTKKRGKKDNYISISHPIICICNDINDKKINELRKCALEVKIPNMKLENYRNYLRKMIDINEIEISEESFELILKNIDLDFRKIELFLKNLLLLFGNKINHENIKYILETFIKKNANEKTIDNLTEIFNKELNIKESINKFYSDKFLYPFLIHENYLYSIILKLPLDEQLKYLRNVSEKLSKNDVIQNVIFEKQLWELNNNSAILTVANTNINHRNLLEEHNIENNYSKRKYTTLLNKVSLYYTNRKVFNTILKDYGLDIFEAYLLSEIICGYIKEKNKEKNIENIVKIIKDLNLKPETIDLLVRIYKFDNVDMKKFYTCKFKNDLKKKLDLM